MKNVFGYLKWAYSKVAFYLIASLWLVEIWSYSFERCFFLSSLLYLSYLGINSTSYYLYAFQSLAFFGMTVETRDFTFGSIGLFPFVMMLLNYHFERHGEIEEDKESYFRHDFLNSIHEMKLFLEHRLSSKELVQKSDLNLMMGSLEQMQSNFCEHYGIELSQPIGPSPEMNCDQLISSCNQMIKNYFPNPELNQIKIHYLFENSTGLLSCYFVDQRRTFRMISNVLKNIYEYNSREIHITYYLDESVFKILFKNSVQKSSRKDELYLSKAILAKDNGKRKGLGLESVQKLASELDGEFSFQLRGDFWISEISIPHREEAGKNYKIAA